MSGSWLVVLAIGSIAVAGDPIHVPGVLINLLEESNVPARIEGVAESILIQEGQLVKEGDVLVQIDRGEALLKVQQAKAELDIANRQTGDAFDLQTAQEEHRIASKDLERANQSNTTFERSISEAEMDRYRFRVQKAAIDIERFKFALEVAKLTRDLRATEVELAEKSLERHEVRAPIDGMVVDIKRRRGEWVKPGDLLLRILRLDRLRAEGYVRADAAGDRLAGTPVYFEVAVPGKGATRHLGKIVFVSPEINPVDGKVLIRAEIDNQQLQLKPGVTGSLLISPP